MDFDESIQMILDSEPVWHIDILGKRFCPDSVSISKSMIPVKKPDTRGGVYFSETKAYKVKCLISDFTVTSILTSTMLGPNTDFTPIKIIADIQNVQYTIIANLTNYIQTKNDVQLNLIVVNVTNYPV